MKLVLLVEIIIKSKPSHIKTLATFIFFKNQEIIIFLIKSRLKVEIYDKIKEMNFIDEIE